jgi:hypothetical protein
MWIVDTALICLKQGVRNIYLSLSQSNRCEDSQINGKKYSSNMSEENKYNINMFEENKNKNKKTSNM